MKRALICGVTGQDGAWLALLLLKKGYHVFGTSRDANVCSKDKLTLLGIEEKISYLSLNPTDFRSVIQAIIQADPDEIYNLSGQSSVALSFEQPVETLESISHGTINILEAIRMIKPDIRFYNAGSSECFGDTENEAATEETSFSPRSPYAVAKSAAFWSVSNYREGYNMFACSGILFNHESWLRPERFVTRKIISAAHRIAHGSNETLKLGNLGVSRDWGWAPEYVEGMWRMLQQEKPDDFVLATGQTYSLEEFVQEAFAAFGLDWKQHTTSNAVFFRNTDIHMSRANPQKATKLLEWSAKLKMPDIVQKMAIAEQLLAKQKDCKEKQQVNHELLLSL
uniref:GDP-mannose 4,6-dehydratase n=1 Tax=Magnetococcus massalia (strain MO-1) TaxID=451514 RepID=A0A1S7LIU0_MAGMO|nr:GDP-D-mannose dehydratase, NAD(P)-binding [Candidatus Magnetococcus massalia]